MHKFLLADNSMALETTPYFIIHLIDPQAMIEVYHEDEPLKYDLKFNYGDETIFLRVHFLFSRNFDGDQRHLEITRMVEKAKHWYLAYLKFEDDQT